jgi:hypothetical protein
LEYRLSSESTAVTFLDEGVIVARILLIDVPKKEVQFDVMTYPIEGGFRGFQNVLQGWHYLELNNGSTKLIGEFVVSNINEVLIFTPEENRLVSCQDANRAQLAASGAMDKSLIDVGKASIFFPWFQATNLVTLPRPPVEAKIQGATSRARNFVASYPDERSALRAAQAAFSAVVCQDEGSVEALQALWSAFANAGSAVEDNPTFFSSLASTLAATLVVAPSLKPMAKAVSLAQLAEDLLDDGGPDAEKPAKELLNALGLSDFFPTG